MVANAENSWPSSYEHLQQRGMTFWLTLWGNRQSNDSIIAGAAFPTTRSLAQWDGRPSPAVDVAIANAITMAERILSKIDNRWPAKQQ